MSTEQNIQNFFEQLSNKETNMVADEVASFLETFDDANTSQKLKVIQRAFEMIDESPTQQLKLLDVKFSMLSSKGMLTEMDHTLATYQQLVPQVDTLEYFDIQLGKYLIISHFNKGDKMASIAAGEQLIHQYANNQEPKVEKKLIEIYRLTGGMLTSMGKFDKCLQYLEKAIAIGKKYDLHQELLRLYGTLGDIYRSNYETDKAITYLLEGLALATEHPSDMHSIGLNKQLGLSYLQKKEHEQAKVYLNQAYEIALTVQNERQLALVLHALGLLYIETQEWEQFEAVKANISSLDIYKNDHIKRSDFQLMFASAYYANKEFDKAWYYAHEYEQVKNKQNAFIDLYNGYELQIDILKSTKQYEQAAHYYQKLIQLRNKMLSEKSKKAFQEFEAKFQNERKEKEIEQLKLATAKYELQHLRSQMNPNFVHKTIEVITKEMSTETLEDSKQYLYQLAKTMRYNFQFTSEAVIPLEDELDFLKNYLNLVHIQLDKNFTYEVAYEDTIAPDFSEVPSMQIQPFLDEIIALNSNAKGWHCSVSFTEADDETIVCTVTDNGIKRNATNVKPSNSQVVHKLSNRQTNNQLVVQLRS